MARECEATGYAKGSCVGALKWDVVYWSADNVELDRHPACFFHGLAEVDRHYLSAGIARCELTEKKERDDGQAGN